MKFTSTARRDGRWWVVQCDQHPSALSQVKRLDQAVEHQREAIAFVADLDESEVEVEVNPVLDQDVIAALERVREQRAQAEELTRSASETIRKVAHSLADEGYSVRDVGSVLGVSFQRAGQLLNS